MKRREDCQNEGDEDDRYLLTREGQEAVREIERNKMSTPWEPALYQRTYRGTIIWTEQAYVFDPCWEWHVHSSLGEHHGRCHTSEEAMKTCEAVVDNLIAKLGMLS